MKTKNLSLALVLALVFPASVLAIDPPIVDQPPSKINAQTYTLRIHSEPGAKITVVGGPSELAPVTDGAGKDIKDGLVYFMVALAQEEVNTFSIVAEMNGAVSEAAFVVINETIGGDGDQNWDTTSPNAPRLNDIPDFVDTMEYRLSGMTEPDVNINVRYVDGTMASSTQSNDVGFFQVNVPLEKGKTNRFNVSAEDDAGNEGPAIQAVIRMSANLPSTKHSTGADGEKITSAQIFFNDTKGHWAEDYIEELREKEVVSGKNEKVFDPNGLITRAELTKIAIIAFGHSTNLNTKAHPFSDVPRNSWSAPYIEEAKRLDIVAGYPKGGFGPNDFVTRAAALKIILKAAGAVLTSPTNDFWDVPITQWFAAYVSYAKANGIIGGYKEDGGFHPEGYITRAEVAKVVVKVVELLPPKTS